MVRQFPSSALSRPRTTLGLRSVALYRSFQTNLLLPRSPPRVEHRTSPLPTTRADEESGRELSGNVQFLKDLTRWTFQETGVLKVAKKDHYRALDGKTEKFYRVGDELVRPFSWKISFLWQEQMD